MEISLSSNSITDDHIATKFGTCHDSPAVVPCAKYCSDHFVSIWMGAKWNFHHIWIVMEKLFVKWAPVPELPSFFLQGSSIDFCLYRQISDISCTKFQNLNVSCLVLRLFLFNILKPGVKLQMKMYLEQCRHAMLQLYLSNQKLYCLLKCNLY